MKIDDMLRAAKDREASDLHLVVNSPPLVRVKGRLEPLNGRTPMNAADIEHLFSQLTSEEEREIFTQKKELDFAYPLSDLGFFRCNASMQRGAISLAIRLLPEKIASIDELGLPSICKELAMRKRGLVVITGPTGSGKSTTLAAMIQHMNHNDFRHIVTIEDPIEYEFHNKQCAIDQRQLGTDTHSFAEALRHVLRQDPDVIMVGEMRDVDTAASVLTIAETGHLVLSTGHAPSAPHAIERIVDLFPVHQRDLIQSRLATLLVAVLCQTLVVRADGSGRVAAVEIMMGTPAVRSLIRDGKTYQLPNAIRTGHDAGMISMDEALAEMYNKQMITGATALEHCNNREELVKLMYKPGPRSPSSVRKTS
jgi:twitching motility protein PilT